MDQTTARLRRIVPMVLPGIEPAVVAGEKPVLKWINPTDLFVDGTYQRNLSKKSISLIKQMVGSFAWNRMKPPICVLDKGKHHVVDGQHTAIAAATIGIPEIPIFVVAAATLDERARAFVGHNTDRITVSPINIYNALLAAGDEDALDVERVCKRAGIRIREINQTSVIAEGDTKAIGLIRRMIAVHGVVKARKVLECLVKAKLKPVSGAAILAAQGIICSAAHGDIDLEILTAAVRVEGDDGIAKARAKAAKDRTTFWHELMNRWLRRCSRDAA